MSCCLIYKKWQLIAVIERYYVVLELINSYLILVKQLEILSLKNIRKGISREGFAKHIQNSSKRICELSSQVQDGFR